MDQDNPHYHLFDSNMLSPYWNKDQEIVTYETSMHRTGMAWSDNISKRFRYYSLCQNVALALDKNLDGDVAECGVWRGLSSYLICHKLKLFHSSFDGSGYHIFDSFEGGLSDKGEKDTHLEWGYRLSGGEIECPLFTVSEKN